MPSLTDFEPLLAESILLVRARMDQEINAGLDPSDPNWADTTEGSVYWDATQGGVIDITRVYDFASTEVPAACFPAYAWGSYLDGHGDTVNKLRKDAIYATGEIQFSGTPGSLVATGTRLSALQVDPDVDPPTFVTTAGAVLAATPGPSGLTATPSGSGGTLGPQTLYYVVTAVVGGVETIVSNEQEAVVPPGGTGSVALNWADLAGATSYKVYRGVARRAETLLTTSATSDYTDTGALVPGSTVPATNLVAIEAEEAGPEGNVAANMITLLMSPVQGVTAIANPTPTSGGADVESDELYRRRILLEWTAPQGAGNQGDYLRWALDYPDVGYATVEPLWNGAGTVRVIILDQSHNPVSQAVVDGLQAQLDPIPGEGAGKAPVGAIVTVTTPSLLTINVSATLTLKSGYSLDGTGGTVAVRSDVYSAVELYVNNLSPGDDVILGHVIALFFQVDGVLDVADVELNGAASNVVVTATQVPLLGTVTLA